MIQNIVRLFRKTEQNTALASAVAGLYLQQNRLTLVLLKTANTQVKLVKSLPINDESKLVAQCVSLLAELPSGTPVCLVLAPERYQLVQLDKPAVAAAEMLQALPWLIRELCTIPVEDMLLDYIDLPEITAQAQSKIQLVVTAKSGLLPLCQQLQRNNIRLLNIQPDEWLPRNLLKQSDGAVMLVTHQPGQEVNVQIMRDGVLYFSRKLRGFNRIDQYNMQDLQQGMLDNLLLEIQRSLDYFEGQLRQAPVREILFLMVSPELNNIISYFTRNGFSQVKILDLAGWMPKQSEAERLEYWPALTGALELLKPVELQHETER